MSETTERGRLIRALDELCQDTMGVPPCGFCVVCSAARLLRAPAAEPAAREPCTCPPQDSEPWDEDWDGTLAVDPACPYHGTPPAPGAAPEPDAELLPLGHPVRKRVEEIAYELAYDARQEAATADGKYPKLSELSLNAAERIIRALLGRLAPAATERTQEGTDAD